MSKIVEYRMYNTLHQDDQKWQDRLIDHANFSVGSRH